MVVEGFPRKIKKLNINVQRLLIIHGGGVAAAFLSSSGEYHKKIRIFFSILNIFARTIGPMDKVWKFVNWNVGHVSFELQIAIIGEKY